MRSAVPQLQDYLEASAERLPEKVALVCGARRLTYRELDQFSEGLARGLAARGVARGDRVLIFGDNTVETVVAFWAALKADAVAVPVNPLTKADRLAYLLADCRPTALITDGHLDGVWKEVSGSPPRTAWIAFVISPGLHILPVRGSRTSEHRFWRPRTAVFGSAVSTG